MSDLFPGVIENVIDYSILIAGICKSIELIGLKDIDSELKAFTFNMYFIIISIFKLIIYEIYLKSTSECKHIKK